MEIGLRNVANGEYYPLARTKVRVGSDPACDILIENDSVAPQHIEIRVTGLGIEVDDLGGPGGTFVNDYRIDQHFLSNHDRLKIGSETYSLEFHANKQQNPGRCERCGVELDERMTRRLSRSLLGATESRLLCERCSRKESGAVPNRSSSIIRRLQHLDEVTRGFKRFTPPGEDPSASGRNPTG